MPSQDKHWAKQYILDPLAAPQPSDETGPGSVLRPDVESTQPIRNSVSTPPRSPNSVQHGAAQRVSPNGKVFGNGQSSPRQSPPYTPEGAQQYGHRKRGSSLGGRFPGDMSHRPLDQLRQEKAIADKSKHVIKKHHIRPDQIDMLDETAAVGAYHHGGPYDATLFARNNSYQSSPVNAVSQSNEETLKATPKEKIIDSLQSHKPLDGVATYEPGQIDRNGHEYDYQPGENMMIDGNPEGGAYKRWPGVNYHPDDIKGKGESSYLLEKALKKHDNEDGTELVEQYHGSLGQALKAESRERSGNQVKRSNSLTKRLSGGLKKRIGSLTRNSRQDE